MRSLLLLVLLASLTGQAQNQYLANDPVWNQNSLCNIGGGAGGNCIRTDLFNYRLVGDSLLAGETYSKVMRVGITTDAWMGGNPPPPPVCQGTNEYAPYLMGLIRQEGLQMYQWDVNEEHLLYDFDLEVGDTLPITINNWNTDITVASIDSFLVGAEWRKRFALNNSWAAYLLEGLGSSNGLLEPISNFFDCGYNLNCFGLGNEVYFPTPGTVCDLAMEVPTVRAVDMDLGVFPNPATDRITITSTQSSRTTLVRLLDLQGRELLRTRMSGQRMDLALDAVPDGVYVLTVGDGRQRVIVAR